MQKKVKTHLLIFAKNIFFYNNNKKHTYKDRKEIESVLLHATITKLSRSISRLNFESNETQQQQQQKTLLKQIAISIFLTCCIWLKYFSLSKLYYRKKSNKKASEGAVKEAGVGVGWSGREFKYILNFKLEKTTTSV